MLNDEDVDKLVKTFSEVFATKKDFKNFEEKNKKDFSDLIN